MAPRKILVLCGGLFAFPSLQVLSLENYLGGIVIGGEKNYVAHTLKKNTQQSNLPFDSVRQNSEIEKIESLLEKLNPMAVFSVGFPFKIPLAMLQQTSIPFINFHPGPLPMYRGPMPIFEVLRAGESMTAVSVHFMSKEFDEGALIFSEPLAVDSADTYGSLTTKLSEHTAMCALNTAQMLEFGSVIPSRQQSTLNSRYYPKPALQDTFIRWDQMHATEILALIRACNPWNTGADTILEGKMLKILSARIAHCPAVMAPGTILNKEPNQQALHVACIENQQLIIDIISTDMGIVPASLFVNQLLTKC